jgi:hypothetical protein
MADLLAGMLVAAGRGMTKLTSALFVSLSALALTGIVHLPRAQACLEGSMGEIFSRQVFPADGSTSVPTNARIYVTYEAHSPGVNDNPRLQTMDGTDVAATVSEPVFRVSGNGYNQTFVLVPDVPLRANTQYTVLSYFPQVPCFQSPPLGSPACNETIDGGTILRAIDGGPAATAVIASFTTGAGSDEVAPVLTGGLTYAPEYPMSCLEWACCGPYQGWDATFRWTTPTDTSSPVFYELSYEGNIILLPLTSSIVDPSGTGTANLRGIFLCSGQVSTSPMMLENAYFIGGSGLYTLVALDQAGNRSQPLQAQVTVDCSSGIDGGPDGSAVVDAPMDTRLPGAIDMAPPSVPGAGGMTGILGTGGATGILGTGGATVVTGQGGAPGTGGSSGTPATTGPKADGGAHDTFKSDGGCSCRIGNIQNGRASLALLAFGLLLARRRHGRR